VYLVLCVVACIFQPPTPLPSLTETYNTLTLENGVEERTGLKWSSISLGCLRLPFVSYVSARVLAYAGWQPNGFFGVKR
jgi:hypothetical protein